MNVATIKHVSDLDVAILALVVVDMALIVES